MADGGSSSRRKPARTLPVVDGRTYDPQEHGARCDLCPLRGNTIVPAKKAALETNVLFVGEAPGRKEEIVGEPFKGMTGQFLRSLCREVDIDIRQAFLTNSALCRSNLDKENEEASVCCAPRLLRELAEFDPKIPIVTFGKSSTLAVLGVRSIMHSRGFVWTARKVDAEKAWKEAKKAKTRGAPKWKQLQLKAQIIEGRSKLAGRTVLPTVHPAFVLRSDTWRPIIVIDMDRIARWVRGDLTADMLLDKRKPVVVTKPKDVERALAKLKPVVAEDIETGASTSGGTDGANPNRNKMLCIGISDGKRTVVIWPWRKKIHAPILRKFHERVTTISMHNGYNFDQIAMARHGVPFEEIEDKLEDTLIAHHTFASHMPQRLSHVATLFVDVGPWKITFKKGKDGASEKGLPPEKLDPKELTHYNGVDALVQARVQLGMQADLKDELAVYEVDKENARLCRQMIIDGIAVDLDRRESLRSAVVKKADDLLAKMRDVLRRPGFHPMQLAEVRRALFTTLRAPMAFADPTESGLPSTSQKTLERLKGNATRAGRFADWLLQWRGAMKILGTYLNSQVLDEPSKKTRRPPKAETLINDKKALERWQLPKPGPVELVARTHFNWRSYGAASGRYSCRLQSCPRAEYLKDKSIVLETRMRELYVAPPGHKLVYFDLSRAELNFAAYLSGDPEFIAACESGDVHTATAQKLFPAEAELIGRDPKGAGKPFRDVEKNCIFGFIYHAEPDTIFTFVRSKGLPVEFRDVLHMHGMVRETFHVYFKYIEQNQRWTNQHGYLRCALSGRISWLGWHAGLPDVANRPVQGGIASLMNVRLPQIRRALPAGAMIVGQIHDAAIMQVPDKHVDRVKELVKKAWEEPVVIPANGYGSSLRVEDGARRFVQEIDLKVGQRWSDFG